jgi:hypothetical protein
MSGTGFNLAFASNQVLKSAAAGINSRGGHGARSLPSPAHVQRQQPAKFAFDIEVGEIHRAGVERNKIKQNSIGCEPLSEELEHAGSRLLTNILTGSYSYCHTTSLY